MSLLILLCNDGSGGPPPFNWTRLASGTALDWGLQPSAPRSSWLRSFGLEPEVVLTYELATQSQQADKFTIRRFDPRFWTINFPRPMMASATTAGADTLRIDCQFYQKNDLCGLIWEAVDNYDHPLLKYETSRDFRGCKVQFHWKSEGSIRPLDGLNSPTLTIEGRDSTGAARTWYVRLWNYADVATRTPTEATIRMDFDNLAGGFFLPQDADPVWAGDIDRMFVSLVPLNYAQNDTTPLATPESGVVTMSGIACTGGNAYIRVGEYQAVGHGLRMATGYDDMTNLTPERVMWNIQRLGYSTWINHYVGMSHYFRLEWSASEGRFIAANAAPFLNAPCLMWHGDLAQRCKAQGIRLIWSLSYELFNAHCPLSWRQLSSDGQPALTGWLPPSSLLSPCNPTAMGYLQSVAKAFANIAGDIELQVDFQVGEPWWWVSIDGLFKPCFYDAMATAQYLAEKGVAAPVITDIRGPKSATEIAYLDWLGSKLGVSTLAIAAAVKGDHPDAKSYVLFYMPQVLNGVSPELYRTNLPNEWKAPAWDVLQLEDYEFVSAGNTAASASARAFVETRLGYPREDQHYFSGFVFLPSETAQWAFIVSAAELTKGLGVSEVFLWSYSQVVRDGVKLGGELMPPPPGATNWTLFSPISGNSQNVG